MITAAVLRLAAEQDGVLGRSQLIEQLGCSASAIQRATADGRLITVVDGVYRVASAPESFRARCRAAVLFGRGDGFIGAETAARLRGLRRMGTRRLDFTVPVGFRRVAPPWMRLRRSSWYAEHDRVVEFGGLVLASPLRMLFGLAADFNQHRFDRAADDAWHLGLVTPIEAWRYLEGNRCRGKDGVARFEAWLDKALAQRAPSQSYLERDLIDAVERLGLPAPVRQYRLTLADGERIHLDMAWPELRFAVEPGSSWFHLMSGGQHRDHQRDLACTELGWLVVRLDEILLADMGAAAQRVARAYWARRRDVARAG